MWRLAAGNIRDFLKDNTTATLTKSSLENISSRYLYYFAIIPIRSICKMCPVTEQVGTAFKSRQRIKLYRHVLTFSTEPRIWSFHVAFLSSTAKKCTKMYNARAGPLFFSLNLIVL